ncbi:MAG: PD-(D/E)XK nuclease family protein [Nakamurella sp.]
MNAISTSGADLTEDLVTWLLPLLGRSLKASFNVFDVMRHGSHEKQISNVFGWLLDPEGTHELGDLFQRIFLDDLNNGLDEQDRFYGPYVVRQEVNTSLVGELSDISDLVLENGRERIIVENYYTSDGHGHSYKGYLRFAERGGRRGLVVLLCQDQDSSRQTEEWEAARVVTYAAVVKKLYQELGGDAAYQGKHREAYSFIDQMYRKFVKDRGRMEDRELLDFLTAMCANGAAGYYRWQKQDDARAKFAEDVANQASERFGEGREVLQRLKGHLRNYSANVLQPQLNKTLGDGFVSRVSANFAGIYQWTINFEVRDEGEDIGEARLQLKFGPSAWFANEQDTSTWKRTVDRASVDYSHVFMTRAKYREIRQSRVLLRELLDGLEPDDRRLHDEIVDLWRDPAPLITGLPSPNFF